MTFRHRAAFTCCKDFPLAGLLREHPGMLLLSEIFGHSHERTTQPYADLLPGHLARAMNAVDILKDLGRTPDIAV
jgi:hypothetical protein